MRAMFLRSTGNFETNNAPLQLAEIPQPMPLENEILIKVSACGVCHTELDEIEGRTPPPNLPVILGHQAVGMVTGMGMHSDHFQVGERVGVAWIFSACGTCNFCRAGLENLCPYFKGTGRDANGGYAEYMTVHQDFAFRIPDVFTDVEAAPLLCAGAIGYRSISLTGLKDRQNLGLTGFGASGHLVLMMAKRRYPHSKVYVFARSMEEQQFARELGAVWAGASGEESPEKLHSIIDTTPVWSTVVEALKNLEPGGRLVINAIRKEDRDKDALTRIDYPTHLWQEKEIKSVANVTRKDVQEFLELAASITIRPEVEIYPLEKANEALADLKGRRIRGAKVLIMENGKWKMENKIPLP